MILSAGFLIFSFALVAGGYYLYKFLRPPPKGDPVLIYETTACFGACPIYKVHLYASGDLVFYGQKHVPYKGRYRTWIPPHQVTNYLRQAVNIGFWKMDTNYDDNQITDLPSTYLTLRDGDRVKKIHARANIPQNLDSFLKQLNKEFLALEF